MKTAVAFVALVVLAGLFSGGCCRQVDTGSVGLKTWFGKITSGGLSEGLYFYSPIGGNVVVYDAKQQRSNFDTEVFTKDIQTTQVKFAVLYSLDKEHIADLHMKVGRNYENKLIEPLAIASIKDVIGQWPADELIARREDATRLVYAALTNNLANSGIRIEHVNILNINFSDAYEKAVEQKQVAMQEAIRAKNNTARVEEESRQLVVKAEAEAQSMQIRAKALEQNKGLVLYEAVQKWDGKLPVYMLGDNMMFLKNIKE